MLGCASCNKWLDINDNPNSPTAVTAPAANRLPWLQYAYNYAYGNAAVTSSTFQGILVARNGGSNTAYTAWAPGTGNGPTTPYQQWFVSGASNIEEMIKYAEERDQFHFIGAAHAIHAMGFMLMLDYYGEMPYTEALGDSFTPKYDAGKTIFEGCIDRLDLAISYFQMAQAPNTTPLSKGDSWNGGDVDKWIKMCYGLKARWLNNLSKKSNLYDPAAILAAANNGPGSVVESTIIHHVNDPGDIVGSDLLGVGDPMKTSFVYDVAAWGNWARIDKRFLDLLENPRGSGIEDPRVDKLVPSSEHWYRDVNGNPTTKFFIRTKGVDIVSNNVTGQPEANPRLAAGPLHISYNTTTKRWGTGSTNVVRQNDTVYVLMMARSAMQGSSGSEYIYTPNEGTLSANDGTILSTGTFYSLPESPTDILTYHEMCFIKAEVYFRQGNKGAALTEYHKGIKAHIDHMQAKLREWNGGLLNNPGKMPMNNADITAFMASAAIAQTAADLTMADIMGQKLISMPYTVQGWNDIRRYDYSRNHGGDIGVVYPSLERPAEFVGSATAQQYFPGATKDDPSYWPRRMKQCGHEINYNRVNLVASNPKAMEVDIYSIPVWWDIEE